MKAAYVLPLLCLTACSFTNASAADRPNVIVIMSDDQGGGDYGFMGNDVIETPNLDAMATRGGRLTRFYVSPVCAPTRACLMTGRYNYRTRCIDTYIGRAMMDTEEITIAEFLGKAGYKTGIFGKWHMGDNYPLRPMDQGFEESLVHRGGGIGQPSDPIGAEGKYTDPTLIHNGEEVAMKGYCTDIYFNGAMSFIENAVNEDKNFFTYIATNAPHGPFHDVPETLYRKYRKVDFSPILVSKFKPARLKAESDKLARIAAMITNIDQNIGRLFKKLNELKITDNTIVMYLNDNGPNTLRYVGEMRGKKSDVDDGGIRSPLLVHWPAQIKAGRTADQLCAHIDLLPSILDACGVQTPKSHKLDGRSFLPLLKSEDAKWATRQIVLQTHRGDVPQLFHHFALHEHPWKLVHPSGFGREEFTGEPQLQLYNLEDDPKQAKNVAAAHPEVFQRLKRDYVAWFKDVSSTREDNFAPPRIIIGTRNETRTVLTRQDWRHKKGRPWAGNSYGVWLLKAAAPADYKVELIFSGDHPAGMATIKTGDTTQKIEIPATRRRGHVTELTIPKGELTLAVDVVFGDATQGPHQVILTRK